MEIVQYYVAADAAAEHGVSVKLLSTKEVKKGAKTYAGKGFRLALSDFEVPVKNPVGTKISYDIWTTKDNAKESVKKCIDKILADFEKKNAEWDKTKEAVKKYKNYLKKSS